MADVRIAVAGLLHETNTFAPFATEMHDFKVGASWPGMTVGNDIFEVFLGKNIPISGFIESASGWEILPTVWASAEPANRVSQCAFDRISKMICDGFADCGPLDGIYLDLHGAMVTEQYEDGEGELLRRIRDLVGEDLPIVVSLDFHANITQQMMDCASAITIFRSYPHLDMAQTGARACQLMRHLVDSDEPLEKAWRRMDFLLPLSDQSTMTGPLQSIFEDLDLEPPKGINSIDIALGFPPADIFDAGGSIVVYGTDRASVESEADRQISKLSDLEPVVSNPLLSETNAVQTALSLLVSDEVNTVVLADAQDNPGAGGTSNSTGLLGALIEAGARNVVLALFWDSLAAKLAHQAGEGAQIKLTLGGLYPEQGSIPLVVTCRVEKLSDGKFRGTGEMYRDCEFELGLMATLRIVHGDSDVRVIVSSQRFQCLDLSILRNMNIEPEETSIIAVKSTVHFLTDFDPIADEVIFVNSPGAHPCKLADVDYRALRPGIRLGPMGPKFVSKKKKKTTFEA